jgi:hypothetical protein
MERPLKAEAREALDHLRRQHRARIARASVAEVCALLSECVQQLRNVAPHSDTSHEAATWNRAADEIADVRRLLRGEP